MGNRVHIVGHNKGNLVHRSSKDDGLTWSEPTVVAPASRDFPMMYGGLYAKGDTVYLLTAVAYMGPAAQDLDVRKSTDNGATWNSPVRITSRDKRVFRGRLIASGEYVHVAGTGGPRPQACLLYFRSLDGGITWDKGLVLADNLGPYGGGQTLAVDGSTVHISYTKVRNGPGGGDTYYIRSTDNGKSWSRPVYIGEKSKASDRQARVQIAAVDKHVLVTWGRESKISGDPLPAERLGYSLSKDGGVTWGKARILPGEQGAERNHQQAWMTPGGAVHVFWRNGNSKSDSVGYMYSPDYGVTWNKWEIPFNTSGANHPYSIVADDKAVHILTGPLGSMKYAHRLVKRQ
ncbi:sialidase family protein [Verrucomicrobiota bacterium]